MVPSLTFKPASAGFYGVPLAKKPNMETRIESQQYIRRIKPLKVLNNRIIFNHRKVITVKIAWFHQVCGKFYTYQILCLTQILPLVV